MTYDEALAYIHRVSWTGSRPGLTRITELLDRMGNPQDKLTFIHVAGTNGKGSFCSMLESILREAGYRTGLYTSPYIRVFNERMQVCGRPISNGDLAELTEYVRSFAETMKDPPTEFELITALAFEYFVRQQCHPVVLEVGMGGRLDATNVVRTSVLAVITGISLDHTAVLGSTVSAIAGEKAGILREGVPSLFGGEDREAYSVISEKAKALHSPLVRTKYSELKSISTSLKGTSFSFKGNRYRLSLLGLYQPRNAATVLTAVPLLRDCGFSIPNDAVRKGLASAEWPARCELLSPSDPVILYDGSHNPEGIEAAVASVKSLFKGKKVVLLTGVMKDKDYRHIASRLVSIASVVFTMAPSENPRALSPFRYASLFSSLGAEAHASRTVRSAFRKAYAAARRGKTPLVILGSLYLYGNIRDELDALKK